VLRLWFDSLTFNPVLNLLSSNNYPIKHFVESDLLGKESGMNESLWQLPEAKRILSKQQPNGSWIYKGGKPHVRTRLNYDQLETFRVLAQLIDLYGFSREYPTIRKTADFLFGFQTEEGDFRGIYGNQYTPNYTAAIIELLTKAGYQNDDRIDKGFNWLISIRQNDGGWAIPIRTISSKKGDSPTLLQALRNPVPFEPDRSKPLSHCITGVVLRAFAAHPKHRNSRDAKRAGELLKSRFFKPDKYPDRKAASFWTSFTFPFWFTDLLSTLDSLSMMNFSQKDIEIKGALNWLRAKQRENGLWKLDLLKNKSIKDMHLWIDLAICRVFKRFYEQK
jgi:hypothetical protein